MLSMSNDSYSYIPSTIKFDGDKISCNLRCVGVCSPDDCNTCKTVYCLMNHAYMTVAEARSIINDIHTKQQLNDCNFYIAFIDRDSFKGLCNINTIQITEHTDELLPFSKHDTTGKINIFSTDFFKDLCYNLPEIEVGERIVIYSAMSGMSVYRIIDIRDDKVRADWLFSAQVNYK